MSREVMASHLLLILALALLFRRAVAPQPQRPGPGPVSMAAKVPALKPISSGRGVTHPAHGASMP